MPPRGRPRFSEAQKQEAAQKRNELRTCEACHKELKRAAWYKHKNLGCNKGQVQAASSSSHVPGPRNARNVVSGMSITDKRTAARELEPPSGNKRARLMDAEDEREVAAMVDTNGLPVASLLSDGPACEEDEGLAVLDRSSPPAIEQSASGGSPRLDASDEPAADELPQVDPGSLEALDSEEHEETGRDEANTGPVFGNRTAATEEQDVEVLLPLLDEFNLDNDCDSRQPPDNTSASAGRSDDSDTECADEPVIHLPELLSTREFIKALHSASLDDIRQTIPAEVFDRLQNPLQEELRIDDPVLRFSLEMYLLNTTENVYNQIHESLGRVHGIKMLSYAEIKSKSREISGIHPVYNDMCINSCTAYTGHLANLTICPTCGEHRYDQNILRQKGKQIARQQFVFNPLGPQIQAAYASRASAEDMSYRARCTRSILEEMTNSGQQPTEFSDYVHGTEYLEAVQAGDITDDSTVLMLSLDGAQLYQSKSSDCWMYIWVFLNRSPETRYKKQNVVIGGVIPGPNKPGNMDSFLFPALQHLAALMKDGLVVWDAASGRVFTTPIFLAFITADGPGMTELNGLVGHSGRYGCRLYCAMRGRRKPDVGIYYPASLKPTNYNVDGSTHSDVDLRTISSRASQRTATDRYETNLRRLIGSRNQTQYRLNRLETGIAKQALISGLPEECMFLLPGCGPGDLMHLAGLNIPDLLVSIWRGLITCDTRLGDDKDQWDWAIFKDAAVWNAHGKQVAAATPYLPGSFDRPPRNPAEKISSGYKAVEFLTYLYGLGPALLYQLLPMKYWKNFCKLVRGVRIIHQRRITQAQLTEAHQLLLDFCHGWEELYYQRMPARLHFVRQSIHALCHIGPETTRIGPYAGVTQWTMERSIGDLGSEIRQPSKPFANLAQRSTRRCVAIALTAMLPELAPTSKPPRGAIVLHKNYVLMCKSQAVPTAVSAEEGPVLAAFARAAGKRMGKDWFENPEIARWARLRLPNGQIARSVWKEAGQQAHGLNHIRIARNVKIIRGGTPQFAEVRYYFTLKHANDDEHEDNKRAYAMIDTYGPPDSQLLAASSNTLWSCSKQADHRGLAVVEVTTIDSVVAMVPHLPSPMPGSEIRNFADRFYVVEKMGLDVTTMAGISVEDPHLDND